MNENKCPFCGAKLGKLGKYKCGTYEIPDINGDYDTGLVCDRDCFHTALVESADEIKSVRATWAEEIKIRDEMLRTAQAEIANIQARNRYLRELLKEADAKTERW